MRGSKLPYGISDRERKLAEREIEQLHGVFIVTLVRITLEWYLSTACEDPARMHSGFGCSSCGWSRGVCPTAVAFLKRGHRSSGFFERGLQEDVR